MTRFRDKLAASLYPSALVTSPLPITVAQLMHPSGVTWTIGGGVMVITVGGLFTNTITTDGSVHDLLNDLSLFGVTTTFADPSLSSIPAGALLPGSGSDADSATSALSFFTTTLWTMIDAYGSELLETEANLVAALDQLYMNTADGEILDVWGGYFGIPRNGGEADPTYYARIVREVMRPRVNRYAIEAAVKDNTGLDVSLREPHKEIFRLSISGLSGGHHLQDGTFFTWNVFQPIYHSEMSLAQRDRVLAIIERNRPAGCLIVGADVQPPTGYVEKHFGQSVISGINLTDCFGVLPFQPGLLSSTLFLSNYRARPGSSFYWTQNGLVTVSTVAAGPLAPFAQRAWTGTWDGTHWNHPSVYGVVTQH